MLSHARIWAAIDRLAAMHALTASALARRAGLDPTTFNRSKRVARDGRPRWPSTESIAKILEATNTDLADFLSLGADRPRHRASATGDIPLLGFAQAGVDGFFDDDRFPVGAGWEKIEFPGMGENVFALEVAGDTMMPLYRDGDTIIVVRDTPCRQGDRVLVKTRDGEVMAKVLRQTSEYSVVFLSPHPGLPDRSLAVSEIEWMARVIWASQ